MAESLDSDAQCPANPEVLLASFLVDVVGGSCETHKGPLRSSAAMQLLHCPTKGGGGPIGSFLSECRGMMNTSENATLRLGGHAVAFRRQGYAGEWTIGGRHTARTDMGPGRRWFYWGRSRTRMDDGTLIELKMPLIGPSMPQVRNCVCAATVSNEARLRMFLARPDGQPQFFFDRAQMDLLERLSAEARCILLGELLRIRATYA